MNLARNKNLAEKLTLRVKYIYVLMFMITVLVACQSGIEDLNDLNQAEIEVAVQEDEGRKNADNITQKTRQRDKSFTILDSVEYDIRLRLKLVNSGPGSPTKQNLWVALISNDQPYQEVLEREIISSDFQIIIDEYGNEIAEFDFSDMPPDSEIEVRIDYRVIVNELKYDLSSCEGELPDFYTSPELHVESQNPQISSLSEELVQNRSNACEQVRAIYDYVGNELVYSYNGGNWGAQAALGKMGADCTEYSSLMIALSRAAGIPARYIEGLIYNPPGNEALARQEHAWLEIFLPGIGWTPMDPTMGRSPGNRDFYFGKLPPDHIIVSRGRNPSSLRGASYWTYIYWPGDSAEIKIEEREWKITQLEN
jgi:transglutaminase-like putative cysteine protease